MRDNAYYLKNKNDKGKWAKKQQKDKTAWWEAKNVRQKLLARVVAAEKKKNKVKEAKLLDKIRRQEIFFRNNEGLDGKIILG